MECPMRKAYEQLPLPLVSLSLSNTSWNASGARASPALTNRDLFILMVPESALRAWKFPLLHIISLSQCFCTWFKVDCNIHILFNDSLPIVYISNSTSGNHPILIKKKPGCGSCDLVKMTTKTGKWQFHMKFDNHKSWYTGDS